jgi:phosphoglycolate phosphatase-like HAD superfamily hydrolase
MRQTFMQSVDRRSLTTIVLDLDGPLLDGMHRHYHCYREILTENGFHPIPLDLYWELKRNRIDRRQLLYLSNATEFYDQFLSTWIERIETKEYLALDRLQNNIIDILTTWKRNGIRLMLATMRKNPTNLHWQLGKLGIAHLLDDVIVVGNARNDVSKASQIKLLLRNAPLQEIIWIGDTEVDILAAREAGVRVCALTCGLRTKEYLASLLPDLLENDLNSFFTGWLKHDQKLSDC